MFSPEAIEQAKKITPPHVDDEAVIFTDYDRHLWQQAFDWYNRTMKPEKLFTLTCRTCYSKVFRTLKQARES